MLGRKRKQKRRDAESSWDVPGRFNFTRDVVEQLARDRERRALTFVDRSGILSRHTFASVAQQAGHWASLFRSRGLRKGDRVLVLVGKVPAWHDVMLGALKAGLVSVPCPELLRARDLAFRAHHAGAALVVADPEASPEVEGMQAELEQPPPVLFLDEAETLIRDLPSNVGTADTAARDHAFILYTSGTTKDPKGAVHTHAYTWAKRMQAERWLDARPDDRVWCTAATGWAKSIWNVLLGPWSQGAEIVLHDGPFDPAERFDLLEQLGVTILCQAPTEYRLMAKLDWIEGWDMRRLRHAVSAGEPLNPEVIARFREAFDLTVHDGYGQTENTLLVANLPGADVRPGSMGLPTPGHEVAVVDESGHESPAGEEGDIALRGHPPGLFDGYWNAPDETAATFRGEWYVTGDRAVRDEEGRFWFTGRADDVITSAAYRIGPFEVESVLLEHPAVAESAVVGKPDPDRGQIVKAFVVLRPGHEASDDLVRDLQERVKQLTAPYKYPREVEFVPSLPKTRSGKIRRVALRRLEEARVAATPAETPGAVPDTAAEPVGVVRIAPEPEPEPAEPALQPVPDREPEPAAEAEPQAEPQRVVEPEPEPEPEPALEPEASELPAAQREPEPERIRVERKPRSPARGDDSESDESESVSDLAARLAEYGFGPRREPSGPDPHGRNEPSEPEG